MIGSCAWTCLLILLRAAAPARQKRRTKANERHGTWTLPSAFPHRPPSDLSPTVTGRPAREEVADDHVSAPRSPPVQTSELGRAEQASSDGWVLSGGHCQHPDRDDSFDNGDWIYLGAGAWGDALLASLPQDARREIVQK